MRHEPNNIEAISLDEIAEKFAELLLAQIAAKKQKKEEKPTTKPFMANE